MSNLSRRYRPQLFADITGQEGIKETLRKEIETKKIGHAYLFSGPRGVGKTTMARIFAKALNCLEPREGEPCTSCAACQEVQNGQALDIIEMDAASHTGVDMVREAIIEHVRFAPTSRAYKVYLLDEAHMLSTAAWNALLKTLEEPPSYAVFILATTEFHKVPATIISRCQRFDFKRLTDEELSERVRQLVKKEGLKIEDDVLRSVVRHADGCVRDAETLLDQLCALGEKNLTADVASLVLPLSRLPRAAEFLSILSRRNLVEALPAVTALQEEGIPIIPFFDDLLEAVRCLLMAHDQPAMQERMQKGDEAERALVPLISVFPPSELMDMALLFMERRRDAKQGVDARFALELAATAIVLYLLPHVQSVAPFSHPIPAPSISPKPTAPVVSSIPKDPPKILSSTPPDPLQPTAYSLQPADISLSDVQRIWTTFIKNVEEQNKSLPLILKLSRPESVEGQKVLVRFQYAFHLEKVTKDAKNKRLVDEALSKALGVPSVFIEGRVMEDAAATPETKSQDVVTTILDAFGGSVISEV